MFEIWTPDTGVFALAREILKTNSQAQLRLWHGGECPAGAHTASELQVEMLKKCSSDVMICGDERQSAEQDILPIGILCDLADRGLVDSVEFRRLARKLLRPCRNKNVKTVAFLDAVLAGENSRKQVVKTLGGKFKTVFLSNVVADCWSVPESKSRQLEIITTGNLTAVHAAAEKILRTKLPTDVVKHRSES